MIQEMLQPMDPDPVCMPSTSYYLDPCSKFVQASVDQSTMCVQTISYEKKERQVQAQVSCKSIKVQTTTAAWCRNARVRVKPITCSVGKS